MGNSREGWNTFRKTVAKFPPLEQLWDHALSLDPDFSLPSATYIASMEEEPSSDGWQVIWDNKLSTLWFDLYPDGRFEYFYRNRVTEETHSEPEGYLPTLEAIPQEVTELLKRFVSGNAEEDGPAPSD